MSELLELFSLSNRPTLPVSRTPQLIYFLTELLPGPRMGDIRLPLHLTIVLDHSAGMAGDKLRALKQAVNWLLEQLQSDDWVSIVVFANQARTVIPAQQVGDGRQMLGWADGLRSVGKHRLSTGIKETLKQAGQARNANLEKLPAVDRILLVVGARAQEPPAVLNKTLLQLSQQNIPIICVGLGNEWDEELLIDLTSQSVQKPATQRQDDLYRTQSSIQPSSGLPSNGDVHYVSQVADLKPAFERILRSMQTCAQDASLAIKPARGVQIRQVWQTRPALREIQAAQGSFSAQGAGLTIPIGELVADGVGFLFEALLEPRPAGAVRIAQSEVHFHVPGMGEQVERDELVVEYSQNLAVTSRLEGYVMDIVQKAQSLKLQTQALRHAEAGEIEQAIYKLRQVAPMLMSQGEIILADRMRKEIEQLQAFGQISPQGRKLIRLAFRERHG